MSVNARVSGGAANVRKGKATQRAIAGFYRTIGRCVVYENSDPGQRKGAKGHRGTPGVPPLARYGGLGTMRAAAQAGGNAAK